MITAGAYAEIDVSIRDAREAHAAIASELPSA